MFSSPLFILPLQAKSYDQITVEGIYKENNKNEMERD